MALLHVAAFSLVPVAVFLVGCSGGGGGPAESVPRCANGARFCLLGCDLGCGQAGCAITEVAENQRLRFVFNQPIDPASVHGATALLRTAAGSAAPGQFEVAGAELTFRPQRSRLGGVGFVRNETYVLTLAGTDERGAALRSVGGSALQQTLNCTVTASGGVVDEDRSPPAAELVAPTGMAPADALIVLRFSEVVDPVGLAGALGEGSPIRLRARRGRFDPALATVVCDPASPAWPVPAVGTVREERLGDREVTVMELRALVPLPSAACIEIDIGIDLRDLAGTAARPARLVFATSPAAVPPAPLIEVFDSDLRRDLAASSGSWAGGARAGRLGGDGRHGVFSTSLGREVAPGVFEIDTDNTNVPAAITGTVPLSVTDGRFQFSELDVPAGVTVRFVGTAPVQLLVRGRARIDGRLLVDAGDQPTFVARDATAGARPGQPGGRGGPGGARGGAGADRCLGDGIRTQGGVPLFHGRAGEDVRVPAGHAYQLRAFGTGGGGSPMMPDTGLNGDVRYQLLFVVCGQMAPGGSGGGFSGLGAAGTVDPATGIQAGAIGVAGRAFDLLPYPPAVAPPGYQSWNHFLVGGAGGGGGGSHPYASVLNAVDRWRAGAGGAGGGGALLIRCGGDLSIGPAAQLSARGGSGPEFTLAEQGPPSPGGGGAGGSIVLQAGGQLRIEGRLDVSGGRGGRIGPVQMPNSTTQLPGRARGGDGAPGSFRLEAALGVLTPAAVFVPALQPQQQIGELQDRDALVGAVSRWRPTRSLLPPRWRFYELEVDVAGTPMRFSDDPARPGAGPANDPNGPVQIRFQGGRVDAATGALIAGSAGPWRAFVGAGFGQGLDDDNATAVRFSLTFQPLLFPDVVVRSLRIVHE